MNGGSMFEALSAFAGWVPAAKQVLYLFNGGVILFVVGCIAAQIFADRHQAGSNKLRH